MVSDNIITGEKIQELADVYLGFSKDFDYNPRIKNQKNKHLEFDNIPEIYNNPPIIFCYTHNIVLLANKLNNFKNMFTLITHNSDDNINENNDSVRKILLSEKVEKWYSQNVCFIHEKLIPLPIGAANSMWKHGNLQIYDNFGKDGLRQLHLWKTKKVYFNFSIDTNIEKRQLCYDSLIKKIPFLENMIPFNNLIRLSKHQFSICPEGNGVDTHRLWESFYFQTVPIVLKSPFIEVLRSNYNLPMVILNSWDEFDESKLNYSDYNFDDSYFEKLSFYNFKLNIVIKNMNTHSHVDNNNQPLDIKLNKLFTNDDKNGIFIELGAHDGLTQSNTAYFEYKNKWEGILIEPSVTQYELCKINRKNSIVLNYACVSNDYNEDYVYGDFNGSLMSSVNGQRNNAENLTKVKAITLEKILDENLNGRTINFLSLDTEGYELPILKGLNLEKYRPKYILIEVYRIDFENIKNFMESQNYNLICNFSNYNKKDNPGWDGSHNDFLFLDKFSKT